MGGQLTKEDSSNQNSTTLAVRKPFDLYKESETKIVKIVDGGGDVIASDEAEDDDDFDPNNYDPKTVGPILPNGEINWECPCLGGAAHGPCGTEFRQAFSCFHYSKDDPKGSDCFGQFREMHMCFSKYPQLYPTGKDDDDEDDNDEEEEEGQDGAQQQEEEDNPIQFDKDELKIIEEQGGEDKGEKR